MQRWICSCFRSATHVLELGSRNLTRTRNKRNDILNGNLSPRPNHVLSHGFVHFLFTTTEAGKVVIVLQGRHAGKKAVVVKTFDDGNSDRRFSHCLIAGLARNPRKVTKSMSKEKVEKRTKQMKPFVKYVNVRHVFPTRYVVDLDLKKAVDEADLVDPDRKVDVKKNLKKVFYDRYMNQKEVTSEKKAQGSSYFFQKLRF